MSSSRNNPTIQPPIVRGHSTGSTSATSAGNPSPKSKSSSSPQQHSVPLRMRSDSSGSIRRAFYQGQLSGTPAKKQGSSGQRRSSNPQIQTQPTSGSGSSRQAREQPDLAQMASMAMVSLRDPVQDIVSQYQQHHLPPPPPPNHVVLDEEQAPRRWESNRADSSYSELLLMMSSTQESLEEGGLEGYGSMQQPRRGPRDSRQYGEKPHDSIASPLLGAALSHDNMDSNGRQQQFPSSSTSHQHPPAAGMLAHSWNRQHPNSHPLMSIPPPPPPLAVGTGDHMSLATWPQASAEHAYSDQGRQQEIALFSSLAAPSDPAYLSPQGHVQVMTRNVQHSPQYFSTKRIAPPQVHREDESDIQPSTVEEYDELDEYMDEHDHNEVEADEENKDLSCWGRLSEAWSQWLSDGVKFDDDGTPYFEDGDHWTSPSAWIRFIVFNPVYPEFTSVQQAFWAVFIGIVMGGFTAIWKMIIEACVELMWKTVPEALVRHGVFTGVNGHFPLPFYIIICPAVFGAVLSYITVAIPVKVPGQNEWIQDVHSRGVHDSTSFWYMFALSTAGMASGMSLGPEGPLVSVGGMFGSKLGLITKQSILQARVLNLTAASAAVGGFFGFPMAGALFVLELPHRMGLQYFEALTPATVATIVAVLTNRMVVKNDITGYYSYPFMNTTLPSRIFVNAICYGAFGALIGILYAKTVMEMKSRVHDLFQATDHQTENKEDPQIAVELTHGYLGEEGLPLVGNTQKSMAFKTRSHSCADLIHCFQSLCKCTIPHEPTRAAVVGCMAGAAVGSIGMFLPHVMFWGEEQLQSLIDKGRTPLPVFRHGDDTMGSLTAYGWCMIDPKDPQAVSAGFSMGCSGLLVFSKILCTGLSLGTGIVGGHFWGPLFCGCAASHFLTDLTTWTHHNWGVGGQIAAYPCVSILCVMGSTHVVTFRAHTAIMLILTLTISAFNPENEVGTGSYKVAGDYSAVFPLLVVAVYTSFILARDTVFYKEQRSRGDIMALPEVLCEPGKVGQPLVVNYDGHGDFEEEDHDQGLDYQSMGAGTSWSGEKDQNVPELQRQRSPPLPPNARALDQIILKNEDEIEVKNSFSSSQQGTAGSGNVLDWNVSKDSIEPSESIVTSNSRDSSRRTLSDVGSSFPTRHDDDSHQARLDELLSRTLEPQTTKLSNFHRRSQSAPIDNLDAPPARRSRRDAAEKQHRRTGSRDTSVDSRSSSQRERSSSGAGRALVRVISYGELTNHQPSLLDQARGRSATNATAEGRHQLLPSLPKVSTNSRHSRFGSDSSSVISATMASVEASTGALTSDDIERTFSSVVNQHLLQQHG